MEKQLIENLRHKAFNIRRHIIMTIVNNGEGHAGPALSCTDIITTVFFFAMDKSKKEKFILSAGHKCLALYGALIESGLIDKSVMDTYNHLGSPVPGHPDAHKLAAVDFSTGSLGHGLSLGCGVCKANQITGSDAYTYVVMGDGEQAEGTVWEAAAFAGYYKLDHLIAFVDRNGLQVGGRTKDIMDLSPLEARYAACGWNVITTDGHDFEKLCAAVTEAKACRNAPTVIICDTIKGKGLPFAEGNYKYHHWDPDENEKKLAVQHLEKVAAEEGWSI